MRLRGDGHDDGVLQRWAPLRVLLYALRVVLSRLAVRRLVMCGIGTLLCFRQQQQQQQQSVQDACPTSRDTARACHSHMHTHL
jgi:hypothetical protein